MIARLVGRRSLQKVASTKEELSSRTLDDDSMESGGDMTEPNTGAAALAAVNAAAPARARMGSMRTPAMCLMSCG